MVKLPDVSVESAIEQIVELQVRRRFYISTTNKVTNAGGALVRRALGWRADGGEAGRTAINNRASRVVAAAMNGKPPHADDADVFGIVQSDLEMLAQMIKPADDARAKIEKDMKRLVRVLPAYAWVIDVKGLGDLGFAVIVGEAGDIGNYQNPAKLWKRLGLAPIEKGGETKAASTWRRTGGLDGDDWTAAGYSPKRRAEIYAVVAQPLFRAQTGKVDEDTGEVLKEPGRYRVIYDQRRARTAETHADWTKAHSNMDGLRIMSKRLIVDLWSEWMIASGRKVRAEQNAGVDPAGEGVDERLMTDWSLPSPHFNPGIKPGPRAEFPLRPVRHVPGASHPG